MNRITRTLIALTSLAILSVPVGATTTITGQYEVSAAISDLNYYHASHEHALYLPAYATDMVFQPGALFTTFSDGTGMLTAEAFSLGSPGDGFSVALVFSGLTDESPTGDPKKELQDHAYAENGGPVDTNTWFYYQTWSGILTGTGSLTGIDLQLSERGAAFQWGIGANGKNIEFGGSGWFNADLDDMHQFTGDFNLNAAPVPLPAGLPLLFSALFGIGIFSRRGQ